MSEVCGFVGMENGRNVAGFQLPFFSHNKHQCWMIK